jgi:hypothetical protein
MLSFGRGPPRVNFSESAVVIITWRLPPGPGADPGAFVVLEPQYCPLRVRVAAGERFRLRHDQGVEDGSGAGVGVREDA